MVTNHGYTLILQHFGIGFILLGSYADVLIGFIKCLPNGYVSKQSK